MENQATEKSKESVINYENFSSSEFSVQTQEIYVSKITFKILIQSALTKDKSCHTQRKKAKINVCVFFKRRPLFLHNKKLSYKFFQDERSRKKSVIFKAYIKLPKDDETSMLIYSGTIKKKLFTNVITDP